MNIRFKTLEWSNMFSYGKNNKIDLDKTTISQLSGSNGHGKTSISLILQELLYSKNVKGIKKGDILNRYCGSKTWSGKVTFLAGQDLYDLRVDRTGDLSKVKLLKNGQDISEHKIPDTYKKVQQVLGLSFEVFSQLIYQSSTDLLDFIKATDTNRKKFLINLFSLDNYLEIGDQIKVKLGELETEFNTLNGELIGVRKYLENVVIKEKKPFKEVPEKDETLEVKRTELKFQLDQFNDICKKIEKNLMLIKERDGLRFRLDISKPVQSPGLQEGIKGIEREIATVEQKIRDLEKQKSKLDLNDKCYACGQHIDNTRSVEMRDSLEMQIKVDKVSLEAMQETLKEQQAKDEKEKTAYKEWFANQRAVERFEQLSQVIDSKLPTEYPNYETIKQEYKNFSEEITRQDTAVSEILYYNDQVRIHNTRVDTIRDQRRDFLARQEILETNIIDLKVKISHLNILKKAFSTSGIVAFKLENLTKQLEVTINKYLAELSDGQFQIIFRLTGEKLNIVVSDNGKEAPIETVSGGEFGRIQTSILLAIRNVLSKIGGNKINVLFLDEITGVLDAAGKERLVEILMQEAANTFFISHDFEHPLIEKILIVKENDISKII